MRPSEDDSLRSVYFTQSALTRVTIIMVMPTMDAPVRAMPMAAKMAASGPPTAGMASSDLATRTRTMVASTILVVLSMSLQRAATPPRINRIAATFGMTTNADAMATAMPSILATAQSLSIVLPPSLFLESGYATGNFSPA